MILVLIVSAFGYQRPQSGTTEKNAEKTDQGIRQKPQDEVVKISVTLVQIDVSVTDKKGRPVSGLKPGDFEIYEDGRRQQITNFSFIAPVAVPAHEESPAKPAAKELLPAPPPPPSNPKPNQVRRTIALVVDDLTLTIESSPYVRQALRKFVDEQMQQGDLVAVVRTGAGMGALQMFTMDKRILYSAIERVRWSPSSAALYSFAPVVTNLVNPDKFIAIQRMDRSLGESDPATTLPQRATDEADRFRQETFAVGTMGAMQFVINGLRDLPGRKSIVLFSEGLKMFTREQSIIRVRDALRNITDLANRSSTVIYTMDARGLQSLTVNAGDDLSGDFDSPGSSKSQATWLFESLAHGKARADEFFESQDGLNALAQQTGGFFIRNTNDLSGGIRRVLNDQENYYLIGFVPEATTFKGDQRRGFHTLKVTVLNRPDLRVRTRSGFYGISDEETKALRKSTGQSLLGAVTSPFNSGDIALRLTSMFAVDPQKGAFVSSLMHIDPEGLTFSQDQNGERTTKFEVAAFTFGDNGKVVDQSIRAYTIRMTEQKYQHTLKAGIFYRVNLPIRKPGAYQLRTAVRDTSSLRVGSANQFIEVPDLKKEGLALSGIIVRGTNTGTTRTSSSSQKLTSTTEGKVEEEDPSSGPAVRKFKRGMAVEYASVVYNARIDKSLNRPNLETQLRLYRDGKPVFAGKPAPFNSGGQKDLSRLVVGGSLLLGRDLDPGEYALQIIVVDKANQKHRAAGQWIDFEIIK